MPLNALEVLDEFTRGKDASCCVENLLCNHVQEARTEHPYTDSRPQLDSCR